MAILDATYEGSRPIAELVLEKFFKGVYYIWAWPPSWSCDQAQLYRKWWGGAMVLVKLPVPGRPTIWMILGQGPIALAVGAGEGSLDIFTLLYPFSPLSPSLWETTRYRLRYCLKGPLNQKQITNQPISCIFFFLHYRHRSFHLI